MRFFGYESQSSFTEEEEDVSDSSANQSSVDAANEGTDSTIGVPTPTNLWIPPTWVSNTANVWNPVDPPGRAGPGTDTQQESDSSSEDKSGVNDQASESSSDRSPMTGARTPTSVNSNGRQNSEDSDPEPSNSEQSNSSGDSDSEATSSKSPSARESSSHNSEGSDENSSESKSDSSQSLGSSRAGSETRSKKDGMPRDEGISKPKLQKIELVGGDSDISSAEGSASEGNIIDGITWEPPEGIGGTTWTPPVNTFFGQEDSSSSSRSSDGEPTSHQGSSSQSTDLQLKRSSSNSHRAGESDEESITLRDASNESSRIMADAARSLSSSHLSPMSTSGSSSARQRSDDSFPSIMDASSTSYSLSTTRRPSDDDIIARPHGSSSTTDFEPSEGNIESSRASSDDEASADSSKSPSPSRRSDHDSLSSSSSSDADGTSVASSSTVPSLAETDRSNASSASDGESSSDSDAKADSIWAPPDVSDKTWRPPAYFSDKSGSDVESTRPLTPDGSPESISSDSARSPGSSDDDSSAKSEEDTTTWQSREVEGGEPSKMSRPNGASISRLENARGDEWQTVQQSSHSGEDADDRSQLERPNEAAVEEDEDPTDSTQTRIKETALAPRDIGDPSLSHESFDFHDTGEEQISARQSPSSSRSSFKSLLDSKTELWTPDGEGVTWRPPKSGPGKEGDSLSINSQNSAPSPESDSQTNDSASNEGVESDSSTVGSHTTIEGTGTVENPNLLFTSNNIIDSTKSEPIYDATSDSDIGPAESENSSKYSLGENGDSDSSVVSGTIWLPSGKMQAWEPPEFGSEASILDKDEDNIESVFPSDHSSEQSMDDASRHDEDAFVKRASQQPAQQQYSPSVSSTPTANSHSTTSSRASIDEDGSSSSASTTVSNGLGSSLRIKGENVSSSSLSSPSKNSADEPPFAGDDSVSSASVSTNVSITEEPIVQRGISGDDSSTGRDPKTDGMWVPPKGVGMTSWRPPRDPYFRSKIDSDHEDPSFAETTNVDTEVVLAKDSTSTSSGDSASDDLLGASSIWSPPDGEASKSWQPPTYFRDTDYVTSSLVEALETSQKGPNPEDISASPNVRELGEEDLSQSSSDASKVSPGTTWKNPHRENLTTWEPPEDLVMQESSNSAVEDSESEAHESQSTQDFSKDGGSESSSSTGELLKPGTMWKDPHKDDLATWAPPEYFIAKDLSISEGDDSGRESHPGSGSSSATGQLLKDGTTWQPPTHPNLATWAPPAYFNASESSSLEDNELPPRQNVAEGSDDHIEKGGSSIGGTSSSDGSLSAGARWKPPEGVDTTWNPAKHFDGDTETLAAVDGSGSFSETSHTSGGSKIDDEKFDPSIGQPRQGAASRSQEGSLLDQPFFPLEKEVHSSAFRGIPESPPFDDVESSSDSYLSVDATWHPEGSNETIWKAPNTDSLWENVKETSARQLQNDTAGRAETTQDFANRPGVSMSAAHGRDQSPQQPPNAIPVEQHIEHHKPLTQPNAPRLPPSQRLHQPSEVRAPTFSPTDSQVKTKIPAKGPGRRPDGPRYEGPSHHAHQAFARAQPEQNFPVTYPPSYAAPSAQSPVHQQQQPSVAQPLDRVAPRHSSNVAPPLQSPVHQHPPTEAQQSYEFSPNAVPSTQPSYRQYPQTEVLPRYSSNVAPVHQHQPLTIQQTESTLPQYNDYFGRSPRSPMARPTTETQQIGSMIQPRIRQLTAMETQQTTPPVQSHVYQRSTMQTQQITPSIRSPGYQLPGIHSEQLDQAPLQYSQARYRPEQLSSQPVGATLSEFDSDGIRHSVVEEALPVGLMTTEVSTERYDERQAQPYRAIPQTVGSAHPEIPTDIPSDVVDYSRTQGFSDYSPEHDELSAENHSQGQEMPRGGEMFWKPPGGTYFNVQKDSSTQKEGPPSSSESSSQDSSLGAIPPKNDNVALRAGSVPPVTKVQSEHLNLDGEVDSHGEDGSDSTEESSSKGSLWEAPNIPIDASNMTLTQGKRAQSLEVIKPKELWDLPNLLVASNHSDPDLSHRDSISVFEEESESDSSASVVDSGTISKEGRSVESDPLALNDKDESGSDDSKIVTKGTGLIATREKLSATSSDESAGVEKAKDSTAKDVESDGKIETSGIWMPPSLSITKTADVAGGDVDSGTSSDVPKKVKSVATSTENVAARSDGSSSTSSSSSDDSSSSSSTSSSEDSSQSMKKSSSSSESSTSGSSSESSKFQLKSQPQRSEQTVSPSKKDPKVEQIWTPPTLNIDLAKAPSEDADVESLAQSIKAGGSFGQGQIAVRDGKIELGRREEEDLTSVNSADAYAASEDESTPELSVLTDGALDLSSSSEDGDGSAASDEPLAEGNRGDNISFMQKRVFSAEESGAEERNSQASKSQDEAEGSKPSRSIDEVEPIPLKRDSHGVPIPPNAMSDGGTDGACGGESTVTTSTTTIEQGIRLLSAWAFTNGKKKGMAVTTAKGSLGDLKASENASLGSSTWAAPVTRDLIACIISNREQPTKRAHKMRPDPPQTAATHIGLETKLPHYRPKGPKIFSHQRKVHPVVFAMPSVPSVKDRSESRKSMKADSDPESTSPSSEAASVRKSEVVDRFLISGSPKVSSAKITDNVNSESRKSKDRHTTSEDPVPYDEPKPNEEPTPFDEPIPFDEPVSDEESVLNDQKRASAKTFWDDRSHDKSGEEYDDSVADESDGNEGETSKSSSNSDESSDRTSESNETSESTAKSSLKYEEEKATEDPEEDSYKQKQTAVEMSASSHTQASQVSEKSEDIGWTPTQVNGITSSQSLARPSAVEMDIEQGGSDDESFDEEMFSGGMKSRRRLLVCFVGFLVFGAIALIVLVVLRDNDEDVNAFSIAPSPGTPTQAPLPSEFIPTARPNLRPTTKPSAAEQSEVATLVATALSNLGLSFSPNPNSEAIEWIQQQATTGTSSDRDKIVTRYVLAALFYQTNGELWTKNDNWLSDEDECQRWYTAETETTICNSEGLLDEIDLDNNNLQGSLPWTDLALLKDQLLVFDVFSNILTGTISSSIGLLSSLVVLDLFDNQQSGTIPSEFGNLESLKYVDLSKNFLTGEIPTEISNLGNIESIWLNDNFFSGTISSSFLGTNTNLKSLYLTNNFLTGSIPQEICSLKLKDLEVDCNVQCDCCTNTRDDCMPTNEDDPEEEKDDDPIFELISSVSNEQTLRDTFSPQSRALEWIKSPPHNIFVLDDPNSSRKEILQRYALAVLYYSTAGDEDWEKDYLWLTRSNECLWFMSSKSNCDKDGSLVSLELRDNKLHGSIPEEIGLLTNLKKLDLGSNLLTGSLPSSIGLLSQLQVLSLFDNHLSGEVPTELSILSNLNLLYMDGNNLNGSVNEVCDALQNVEEFSADCNELENCLCCTLCCDENAKCVSSRNFG